MYLKWASTVFPSGGWNTAVFLSLSLNYEHHNHKLNMSSELQETMLSGDSFSVIWKLGDKTSGRFSSASTCLYII